MDVTQQQTGVLRWALIGPAAALVGALTIAVVGAAVTGTEIGTVTGGVESASAGSSNFLARVADLFPLGFAFSAGMVSSVNPCGFAMLPAYLGLYLGETERGEAAVQPALAGSTVAARFVAASAQLAARVRHAVLVGSTMSLGFIVMFALVGVPIGLGARGLVGIFPWVGLGVGVLLAVTGAYLLSGGKLYTALAMRLSERFAGTGSKGVRSYFTFGLGYGAASLSCTLPIFLAVIGGAFTADTFLDSLLQFALYGFGMGTVILALTIAIAVFKGAMVGSLRRLLPYVGTISAVMLLVAGAFIVYYWLTIGELFERITRTL